MVFKNTSIFYINHHLYETVVISVDSLHLLLCKYTKNTETRVFPFSFLVILILIKPVIYDFTEVTNQRT